MKLSARAALAALPLSLSLLSQPAQAQTCAARELIVSRLAETYGESRQSMGLGANNSVVEVFASDAGTWTIIVTMANGTACLIASGQAFEQMAEALPPLGDEA